jgi:hypothetical protein
MHLGELPNRDSFKGKVLSVTKASKLLLQVESILIIYKIHKEVKLKK